MPIVTLTTDFGLSDGYVGAMKGVILSIAPTAALVDIGHDIPPQDVLAGALALEAAFDCFPTGTIHLAVVDPGVGSARAAVAVQTEHYCFIGPDNGLFSLALAREPMRQAVRLTNRAYHRRPVSATFHGRDLFAPAAAHLAAGAKISDLGRPLSTLTSLDLPRPAPRGGALELHVLHVDRFGNLLTDLTAAEYALWKDAAADSQMRLCVCDIEIKGIRRTYADVKPGQPVAYFGSGGRLEIGVRDGNARETLGAGKGAVVLLEQRNRGRSQTLLLKKIGG